jgi:hypothetical protein
MRGQTSRPDRFQHGHLWLSEVHGVGSTRRAATLGHMSEADGKPLDERLQEIRAQLAWVRDYL